MKTEEQIREDLACTTCHANHLRRDIKEQLSKPHPYRGNIDDKLDMLKWTRFRERV